LFSLIDDENLKNQELEKLGFGSGFLKKLDIRKDYRKGI